MPLITKNFIYRSDLRSNPRALYLFGDNHLRIGLSGQAKEMRGEPNARGIRTKWRPSFTDDAFFSDEDFPAIEQFLMDDFREAKAAICQGRVVVMPQNGLGTGLSELPTRAPKIYALLLWHIEEMS